MDDEFKKAAEKYGVLAEAMKPSPAMQTVMEAINPKLAKVPNFAIPALSHELRPLFIPRIPAQQEINNYQSASVLMQALADDALRWKKQLTEEFRPAILAVLYGGIQIHVQTLSQVSFHGIRVEGTMNGAPCSLLAHQSTVQLLCYAEKVDAEEPKNPIGFVWDDKRIEV